MRETDETAQPLQGLEEWDDFVASRYRPGKSQEEFRNYSEDANPGVAEFYRQNHAGPSRARQEWPEDPSDFPDGPAECVAVTAVAEQVASDDHDVHPLPIQVPADGLQRGDDVPRPVLPPERRVHMPVARV